MNPGPDELRRLDPEEAGDRLDRLYRTALAMCGSPETREFGKGPRLELRVAATDAAGNRTVWERRISVG